jgi:hypothetical protein
VRGIVGGDQARVDLTAPRGLRRRSRLRFHRARLPADEVTVKRGIPVTTPARTLLDLAAVTGGDAQAEHEADALLARKGVVRR